MATKMTREEALNIVRQMSLPKETMEILEALAPELAESKDERIRRKMIEHFKAKTKETWCNMPVKDIIAYLEKQKDINCLACDQHLKGYLAGRKVTEEEKQKEQKPAEWSEEDKDMLGKVLECIRFAEDHYQLEQDETNGVAVKWWLLDHIIPQPKVEWSEEDEKKIIFLESLIEFNVPDGQYGWVDGMKGGFVTKSEAISMLKSLRPQYHGDVTMTEAYKMGLEAGKASSWKPSEEDLMMLEHIIGQYEIGNKNSKVMGYLPRIEELDFLKKVLAKWKN